MTDTDIPDERYLSIDSRDIGKIIKVIAKTEDGKYVAETVANEGAPHTIGRKSKISEKTMKRFYTKISH